MPRGGKRIGADLLAAYASALYDMFCAKYESSRSANVAYTAIKMPNPREGADPGYRQQNSETIIDNPQKDMFMELIAGGGEKSARIRRTPMNNLDMRKIPATRLNPAEYNPRKDLKPGDAEYEKLLRSVEEFGYVEPIIWNERTGRVVGGHQRLKVLLQLGFSEIDCVVALPIKPKTGV